MHLNYPQTTPYPVHGKMVFCENGPQGQKSPLL